MSGVNKLRELAVKVCDGSGCLFTLESSEYTYVLTAKHVIEDEPEIVITRQKINNDQGISHEYLEIIGKPYLHPDPNKDAAIIKVKAIIDIPPLSRVNYPPKNYDGYYLIGHPDTARAEENSYRQDKLIIHNPKPYGYIEAELEKTTVYRELTGQSGGGIIRVNNQKYLLIGIQKGISIANEQEMLSRIDFMPISFFDEIINENAGNLEVLPIFDEAENLENERESPNNTNVNIETGFFQPNWQIKGNLIQNSGDIILNSKDDNSNKN